MSDHRPADGPSPELRRWPVDPAQLTDTTLCPACFTALASTRCGVCELDLSTPASLELLAAGRRVRDAEHDRQRLITGMRSAQAEREAPAIATAQLVEAAAPSPVEIEVAGVSIGTAPLASPPVETTIAEAPDLAPAAAPAVPVPVPTPMVEVPVVAAPAAASEPPASAPPTAPKRSGRSGVQVFLLTLGVVLISITAIVFLFVAYLVASLEVRSIITAALSVVVLGVAWLLRARRLPGTAEGVASVAVVLLLLDVWIVRANALFGTDRLDAAGYAGGALLVVAALLAGTRAVSGLRVPGFAAAALAPVAVFLLVFFQLAPADESATGFWAGSLTAALLGIAAVALRPSTERAILMGAGFGAGAIAMCTAAWALPSLAWHQLVTFAACAVIWTLALVALRVRRATLSSVWAVVAPPLLGISAALAPTTAIAAEMESAEAIWLAPAASGAVLCFAAVWVRRTRPDSGTAMRGFLGAGAVAAIATAPGAILGLSLIGEKVSTLSSPWQPVASQWVDARPADELGAVLVPLVAAVGALAVLALLGAARRLIAVPVGALLAAGSVLGAVLDEGWVAALVLTAVAAAALALASLRFRPPGLRAVLAVGGMPAAALALVVGYADASVWPWAVAGVLALSVAGRVLAGRVWPEPGLGWAGLLHLVLASSLVAAAMLSVPGWLTAADDAPTAPWSSPAMWLGTVGSALLLIAALVHLGSRADRVAFATPLIATGAVALVVVALDADLASFRWLPSALFTVAGFLWAISSRDAPALRAAFAALTPVALAITATAVAEQWAGGSNAAYGAAGAVLASAALAHVFGADENQPARLAWVTSTAFLGGIVALSSLGPAAGFPSSGEPWLVLLILTPVPVLLAALEGDPIAGDAPERHAAWLSVVLAVGSIWAWLAGEGVDDVEAYTLPLAGVLAATAALIVWRRRTEARSAFGRTALIASAAAVAVLPSVGSTAGSELRTLVLAATGAVIALAASFLPESARGVPIRLLGVVTGWTAATGAATVRGIAVAAGAETALPIEFWPMVALAVGIFVAVVWARSGSRPRPIAEALLAASVALASAPTIVAIAFDDQALLRAAVLLPLLGAAHVAGTATDARPIAGPIFAWATRAALVLGGLTVLLARTVEPFDLVTTTVGLALAAGGALTRRTGGVASLAIMWGGAALAVLPSVVACADSEPRTVVLVVAGAALALAAGFVPETVRGAPLRLLAVAVGWTAATGAALVRAVAVVADAGASSTLPVEFWPAIALATGILASIVWARSASRPGALAEVGLAASLTLAILPTLFAIVSNDEPALRAAILFPLVAVAHVAAAALTVRPFAGPVLLWTTRGILVLGGLIVIASSTVDPFDLVTAPVGLAFIAAGAFALRRSPELGSWPALGAGLAILLLPPLIADFVDPELWRIITLGIAAALAVIIGAMRRLQAPFILGGSVLLVHAIVQLWPAITWLYEAVWWWLWLGIAGVVLVVLAATYERQIRLARSTISSIGALR